MMPHQRRGLVALVLAAMLLFAAAPALAQDDEETQAAPPELLLVDASSDPYLVVRTASEPFQVEVSVAGNAVGTDSPTRISRSNLDVQTLIVIDNSAASSEFLDDFKSIAVDYVDAAPASESISIWTTGGTGRLRVGYNSEHARTAEIVDRIKSASGGNMMWDAVRGGTGEFRNPVSGAANVIVLTANVDQGSNSTAADARGAVLSSNASAFMVHGLETSSVDEPRFVDVTDGGAYAAVEESSALATYGSSLSQVIGSTWVVSFDGPEEGAARPMSVVIDGTAVNGTYSPGVVASSRAVGPVVAPDSGSLIPGLGFLRGSMGRTLGLAMGAVAVALGAYSITMLLQKDSSELNDVLMAYSDPMAAAAAEDGDEGGIASNQFVKRAIEISEGFAERQGGLQKMEGLLERADMPLRVGEALTAYAGIVLGAMAIGLVLIGSLPGLLVMGVLGILIPPTVVRFIANRRRKVFMGQLPDTLQLLSSTLKAGYSFMQGVEAVSHEVDDPMGGELRRIVTEAQLGRPLEEAMDASAERMESDDFAWAVMAVRIQREVGGNLSELLLTVAETMTERERLRRDVAALTAEGKMSAVVLGVLPILLGMAMWALNPEYINTLFNDGLGQILLGTSITAALIGFAWMKKIINIEI